ncbi:MAG TPA: AgmX/PglI C-terminal domain-containing protein, partial [Polyangia bacterium]|nr:AgmX/PglI C-terminal domain-containing protein [Polyangia bacterium]
QGLQSSRQVKTGAGERQKGSSKGATAHAVTMTAVERHNAKQLAEEQANNAGVVGLFKSYEGTHFGGVARDLALGPDADTVLSGLTARDVDAYGNGGTSVVASGKGAGGTGDSTIAGGTLDTIGKGGHGGRSDYGRGAGGPLGNHRLAALPGVVPGTANVRGALDKEIIRRVVRRHLNEVKFCYEKALIRQSSLSGRVTMQFTIGANGRVLASIVQSSTLNDREVEQCLQAAVSRWEFPQPNGGGIVIVSYPLVLKYADL